MNESHPAQDGPRASDEAPSPRRWGVDFGHWLRHLSRVKGTVVAVAGVGAVLSGLVGYYTTYRTVIGPNPTVASVAPSVGPLSIVVLPFANLSGDANKGYIADALTTSLTSDLSRIREAFVIGSATAFTYRDKAVPLQQIGKELGVRFVLQGSVQANDEQIRINAQLADTQSNAQLWSESFDGESTNLFALQDQVTRRIANSIGRQIVVIAARDSASRRASARTTDLMLRAIAIGTQPRSLENARKMEALFRQVLAAEPDNANAMARLSRTLWAQAAVFAGPVLTPEAKIEAKKKKAQAYELAFKARELDPNNPLVYFSLARFAGDNGDIQGRRTYLETALALDPKSSEALTNLSVLMNDMFEPQKAMDYAGQAIRLDPRYPTIYVAMRSLGIGNLYLGKYDEAVDWLRKSLAENQADAWWSLAYLALAYGCKGEADKAEPVVAELLRLQPGYSFSATLKPDAGEPAGYKALYEQKLVPAARIARLPP
jgi:adenylate cyclase